MTIQGPATIVGGGMMNVLGTDYRRWETGSDFTAPTFNMIAVRPTTHGVPLPPEGDGWDDGSANLLLGYLDLAGNNGYSEISAQVGNGGITRQNGSPDDQVALGWGGPGPCDPIPCSNTMAIIAPEPAAGASSLLLWLLHSARRVRRV